MGIASTSAYGLTNGLIASELEVEVQQVGYTSQWRRQ